MKRFRYGMESILKIKYRLEDQAKGEYAQAKLRYEEQVDILDALYRKKAGYEKHLRDCMADILDFQEIQITKNGIIAMEDAIKKQTRVVMMAERQMEAAREKLNTLMVERKTQETLKEHAFTEYKKEVQGEENKEIDELVSFRFNR